MGYGVSPTGRNTITVKKPKSGTPSDKCDVRNLLTASNIGGDFKNTGPIDDDDFAAPLVRWVISLTHYVVVVGSAPFIPN